MHAHRQVLRSKDMYIELTARKWSFQAEVSGVEHRFAAIEPNDWVSVKTLDLTGAKCARLRWLVSELRKLLGFCIIVSIHKSIVHCVTTPALGFLLQQSDVQAAFQAQCYPGVLLR